MWNLRHTLAKDGRSKGRVICFAAKYVTAAWAFVADCPERSADLQYEAPPAMTWYANTFPEVIMVQNRLAELQLPQLSRRINEAETFKISVQVVAASILGLSDNGLLTRERPRVSAVLAGVRKETEFGDSATEGEFE
ncbi:unnamed protein product, partial [Effrenium voratum]